MPILRHQIEALVKVGVKDIVLAVNVQPEQMMKYLEEIEKHYGIKIHLSIEDTPMGTAGPLALARQLLDHQDKSSFFVLNSDVICEFPMQEMLDFHVAHGHEGTVMVVQVTDPTKYGVVVFESDEKSMASPATAGLVRRFVEKPQQFVGDKINAGIYLFKPSMLSRIELRPTSIERETFPAMAADSQLHAFVLPGYWMDIGQPKDYLSGMVLHLSYMRRCLPSELAVGPNIIGNVLIHQSAQVHQDAVLGPDVVIGPNVIVEAGARVKRSTILEGSRLGAHSWLNSSIIGWQSTVGKWTRVEAGSVLGMDVQLADEIVLAGAIVFPHKAVRESSKAAEVIY